MSNEKEPPNLNTGKLWSEMDDRDLKAAELHRRGRHFLVANGGGGRAANARAWVAERVRPGRDRPPRFIRSPRRRATEATSEIRFRSPWLS